MRGESSGAQVALNVVLRTSGDRPVSVVVAKVPSVVRPDRFVASPALDQLAGVDAVLPSSSLSLVVGAVATWLPSTSVTVTLLAVLITQAAVGVSTD